MRTTWVDVIAFSMGRDAHERKKLAREIVLPIVKKFGFSTHCECCGHVLSTYESMKKGVGPLCAGGECQCKVEHKKTWSRDQVMEVANAFK